MLVDCVQTLLFHFTSDTLAGSSLHCVIDTVERRNIAQSRLHVQPRFKSGDHTCAENDGRDRMLQIHTVYQEESKTSTDSSSASAALCKIKKFSFLNDDGGKTLEV